MTSLHPLHRRLLQEVRVRKLWSRGDSLLIGVSGGQDSLCLLKLLADLCPEKQWKLHVLHLDHAWRETSVADSEVVRQFCETLKVPCTVIRALVAPTSEAEARTWRYEKLQQVAQSLHIPIVLTAHTASDRAETLLFNLTRGSAMDGLGSLPWVRNLGSNLQLIRPLLSTTRPETQEFCRAHSLPVCLDPTNEDLNYQRNRIRLELLPYLTKHFNPQIEQSLSRTVEILSEERRYLEAQTQKIYEAVYRAPNRLHRLKLREEPLALQRRVILKFLGDCLYSSRGGHPYFDDIETVRQLLHAPNQRRTRPLIQGISLWVQEDWVVIQSAT
jgi:tRNA(Ile)-lysidine synthase